MTQKYTATIYEKGVLFKKLLGIRALLQTSIRLDHEISHTITYMPVDGSDRYELTLFARLQKAPVAAWVLKLELQPEIVTKFMRLVYKMLLSYEKLNVPRDQEVNLHGNNSENRAGRLITDIRPH